MLNNLKNDIENLKNPEKAKLLSGFFKTWVWEYWFWDIFLWLMVPQERIIAKKYVSLDFLSLKELISSPIHDERIISVFILLEKNKKASLSEKEEIFNFYVENRAFINNWDLVDLSSPKIIWEHLFGRDRSRLYDFAKSDNLWERRISVLSTFYFIKYWDFSDTLNIIKILINDKQDLIHKACWWALREIGKKDINVLRNFLDEYKNILPRTTLGYAIERMDTEERKKYLKTWIQV